MKTGQIQKLIFIFLTFPNILIQIANPYPSTLGKLLISNKGNRLQKQNNFLKSKIYSKNKYFANLENKNGINTHSESINKNINAEFNELLIESKVQSEKDDILYAEDEVIAKFKDNILKADRLTYNKKTKLAKAEGNIHFKIGNQSFQADIVEYDFVKKRGDFKNVKGLINS